MYGQGDLDQWRPEARGDGRAQKYRSCIKRTVFCVFEGIQKNKLIELVTFRQLHHVAGLSMFPVEVDAKTED
jgi:hypothetical protein